jgi:diaminopimelate epimerase
MPFVKMVGTGNDFIVMDNRSGWLAGSESNFFSGICRRRLSIGADGVILLERPQGADVRMRYFNRDGHEASMCGNGGRCLAWYARQINAVAFDAFSLEAADGRHRAQVDGSMVSLEMVRPRDFRPPSGILRPSDGIEGGFIDTGVPHFIIFVENAGAVDVAALAPFYRNHPAFSNGANVDFVQHVDDHRILVRTYERGVEGETLSCGTGCVASALVASRRLGVLSPVEAVTPGGFLNIRFDPSWEDVWLQGPVEKAFEGILDPLENPCP